MRTGTAYGAAVLWTATIAWHGLGALSPALSPRRAVPAHQVLVALAGSLLGAWVTATLVGPADQAFQVGMIYGEALAAHPTDEATS